MIESAVKALKMPFPLYLRTPGFNEPRQLFWAGLSHGGEVVGSWRPSSRLKRWRKEQVQPPTYTIRPDGGTGGWCGRSSEFRQRTFAACWPAAWCPSSQHSPAGNVWALQKMSIYVVSFQPGSHCCFYPFLFFFFFKRNLFITGILFYVCMYLFVYLFIL